MYVCMYVPNCSQKLTEATSSCVVGPDVQQHMSAKNRDVDRSDHKENYCIDLRSQEATETYMQTCRISQKDRRRF